MCLFPLNTEKLNNYCADMKVLSIVFPQCQINPVISLMSPTDLFQTGKMGVLSEKSVHLHTPIQSRKEDFRNIS